MDAHVKVSQVIVMRHGTDSWNPVNKRQISILTDVRDNDAHAYGSAISRSVSFMILFGSDMLEAVQGGVVAMEWGGNVVRRHCWSKYSGSAG